MEQTDVITNDDIQQLVQAVPELKQVLDLRNAYGGQRAVEDAINDIKKNFSSLKSSVVNGKNIPAAQPAQQNNYQQQDILEPIVNSEQAKQTEQEHDTKDEEEDFISELRQKTPYLSDIKIPSSKKQDKASRFDNIIIPKEIESVLAPVIQKNFGIEKGDIKTFLKSAAEWRKSASQYEAEKNKWTADKDGLEKELSLWKGIVNEAPQPIIDALQAYYNPAKGDWREVIREHLFAPDFNRPFEHQDLKQVIRYFNKNLNLDDKERDDYIDLEDKSNPYVRALIEQTQSLFNKKKKEIDDYLTSLEQNQATFRQSLDSSVKSSLDNLRETIPQLSRKVSEEIESIMRSEAPFDLSYLKNSDGTFRKDAALRIYNMLHAQEDIAALRDALNRVIKHYSEKIYSAPATASPRNSGSQPDEINSALKAIQDWGRSSKQVSHYAKAKMVPKNAPVETT